MNTVTARPDPTDGAARQRRGRGDAGSSLLEVLMAMVVLGLAGASILGGLLTSVRGSDLHRQQTQVEVALVSAVEALKDPGVARVPCAGPESATYVAAVRSATLPSGWDPSSAVRITSVRYSNGVSFGTTCHDTDALRHLLRSQLITVEVTSPDGRARQSVAVVKGTNA